MPCSHSSNSAEPPKRPRRGLRWLTLLCRLAVGCTFAVSGWAKAIDPYGFVYKTGEYLAAWHLEMPREIILAACVALAIAEFCTGVMVLIGTLRRVAVWFAAAMMAGLLPLTAYITVASPVADCGCFGDLLILSNWATFGKNIVLTAAIIYLLRNNRRLPSLIPAPLQWIAALALVAYGLFLSLAGYHIQPLVDFRPYRTGTEIFNPAGADSDPVWIFEKDGQRREFTLDALPDSTWTFIDGQSTAEGVPAIAIRNEEGDDMTEETVGAEDLQIWVIVNAPTLQVLPGARKIRQLAQYSRQQGIGIYGVVAGESGAREWESLTHPGFPVFSADDTALKTLARGDAAVVLSRTGEIVWKRTLASIDPDWLETPGTLETIPAPDRPAAILWATAVLGAILATLTIFGLFPRLLRRLFRPILHKNA